MDGAARGVSCPPVCDINSEYYGTFGYFGHDPGEFVWASCIAADSEERLFISDEYTNRITVFDLDGSYQANWGTTGSGKGQLDGPAGLAIGSDGSVYVADTHNHRVQRFTPSGVFLASFGSHGDRRTAEFDLPWGLTVSPSGDVYVADWGNDPDTEVSQPTASFVATYGSSGTDDGRSSAGRPGWRWTSAGTCT